MVFINSLFISMLSLMPKWISRPFAKPYIAGETIEEALLMVKQINDSGFSATIDILGEHTTNKTTAQNITEQYCELYSKIHDDQLDCNISIKPTHVGLFISIDEAVKNISKIIDQAMYFNNFLRLDMENSSYTDQTFEILKHCKYTYSNVGVAIQSYLRRSIKDVKTLSNVGFNARICKGIYKEKKHIAFHDRKKINENFILMAKTMARKGAYAGYATHDQGLIDELLDLIVSENISKDKFEFQFLFGVPMAGRLDELRKHGYKIRVYVPFGPDWFDYSIRRLKENPNIAGYVIANLLKTN